MISVDKYIEGVNSIYAEQPTYKTGHDGSDGMCDCIGMCKGGLKRGGATGIKNMNGTNTAARKTIQNLVKINSVSQLKLGDVVLKVRDKDDKDMPLPDKFRKGGSEYSEKWGETNFTHIGTVTGVNPLEITHMTSPTAAKDTKLGRWEYVGQLPWVEEGGIPAPSDPVATVYAHSGSTVNLRMFANIGAKLIDRVPIGDTVDVLKYGDEWTRVEWRGKIGWMKTNFLVFDGDVPPIYCTVTIPGLSQEQADSLIAQYPNGIITVG